MQKLINKEEEKKKNIEFFALIKQIRTKTVFLILNSQCEKLQMLKVPLFLYKQNLICYPILCL
jgi:hypothetical protein